MNTKTEELTIKYPSGFEYAVHMTKEEMEQHIRLMAALKMFELGKISSGKAAELAGMSRVEFLETCGRYRVSIFNYPPEEVKQEIEKDLETARKLLEK
jgi:predicted HTH domain antitoxin